jgi:hypothetical protein
MKFPIVLTVFLAMPGLLIAGDHLPGNTITNEKGTTLQGNVRNSILALELKIAPACRQPRIIRTEIVGDPRRLGRMMQWNERWTVDRCGKQSFYKIHFDFRGSVGNFKIEGPPN